MGGSSNGSGLYQSDDTGKTWRHLGWNNIKCFSMDMVQSSNGRILYEATGLGVLRSVDGGEHWKQLTDWRISEVMDIMINPYNKDHYNEIDIATAHGLRRSLDGGQTWEAVSHQNIKWASYGDSVDERETFYTDSCRSPAVYVGTLTGIDTITGQVYCTCFDEAPSSGRRLGDNTRFWATEWANPGEGGSGDNAELWATPGEGGRMRAYLFYSPSLGIEIWYDSILEPSSKVKKLQGRQIWNVKGFLVTP